MTRINFGIEPAELCDQMLIAEYRELPRVFAYKDRILPGPFRLNKGHVIWCSQFPGSLADRYRGLVREMRYRGIAVNNPEPRGDGRKATPAELAGARELLIERIVERLDGMRGRPRWTLRTPPAWAC